MRRRTSRIFRKHGIGFEAAQLVFEDLHQLSFQDRVVDGEVRWRTFGVVGGSVVMVAHTWWQEGDEEVLRLISARIATRREKENL